MSSQIILSLRQPVITLSSTHRVVGGEAMTVHLKAFSVTLLWNKAKVLLHLGEACYPMTPSLCLNICKIQLINLKQYLNLKHHPYYQLIHTV